MDIPIDIEEGEVSDNTDIEDVEYSPLERPVVQVPKQPVPTAPALPVRKPGRKSKERKAWPVLSDDESDSSSSSDSDDDGPTPVKRKMVHAPSQGNSVSDSRKNNIWGSVIFEQTLEKDIKLFGVDKKQNARDVESYSFKKFDENGDEIVESEEEAKDEPETMEQNEPDFQHLLAEMKNRRAIKRRLGKPKEKKAPKDVDARFLRPLETSVENDDEEVARDIQEKLFEKNYDLVFRTVHMLGKEAAIRIFNETRDIEEQGGLKIVNGTRRRTSGGVFFFLLRKDPHLPMDKVKMIFKEESKEQTAFRKKLKAQRMKEQSSALRSNIDITRAEALIEKVNQLAAKQEEMEEGEMEEQSEAANVFSDATPTPVPSPIASRELQQMDDFFDDCVTIGDLEPL